MQRALPLILVWILSGAASAQTIELVSASHTDNNDVATDLSWSVAATAPEGLVLAATQQDSFADEAPTFDYNSLGLTEATGSPACIDGGEDGCVYAAFVGSGISSGTQTATIDFPSPSAQKFGFAVVLDHTADLAIQDVDKFEGTCPTGENTVGTLTLGGNTSRVFLIAWSDRNTSATVSPITGWTSQIERDHGPQMGVVYTYDTLGTADVSYGLNVSTGGPCAIMAFAITETGGAPPASDADLGQLLGVVQ